MHFSFVFILYIPQEINIKDKFSMSCCPPKIQESVKSIREKYGSLNLLINTSGILSIPDVLQPGKISYHHSIWMLGLGNG